MTRIGRLEGETFLLNWLLYEAQNGVNTTNGLKIEKQVLAEIDEEMNLDKIWDRLHCALMDMHRCRVSAIDSYWYDYAVQGTDDMCLFSA